MTFLTRRKSANSQDILCYLHALDLELHVVLPGGLPVLPLLPAVSVTSVSDLLAGVEQHGSRLWPRWDLCKTQQWQSQLSLSASPYLNFFRQPVMVTVKGDQHRCNFLQKYQQKSSSLQNSFLLIIVINCFSISNDIDICVECCYQVVITQKI